MVIRYFISAARWRARELASLNLPMKEKRAMKDVKLIRISMLLFHVFVGMGAVAGGLGAILNPVSPGGANAELLKTGPFETFLIPGIILFTLFGLGNLTAAILLVTRWRRPERDTLLHGYATGILGAGMIIWIVVQCLMLQMIVPLHVIMFCVGVLQGLYAFRLLWNQGAFPANLVRQMLGGLK
jgi:hypothetical protein